MRNRTPEIRRLALMGVALVLGAVALAPTLPSGFQWKPTFGLFVALVLSVGMFASARRIRIEGARGQLGTILVAGSMGGSVKGCLIAAGLLAMTRVSPTLAAFLGEEAMVTALLFGLVIAQIDPVSVTESLDWKAHHPDRLQLSVQGQALIHSWSTIDDLASLVLTSLLLPILAGTGGESLPLVLVELALNIPFFAAILLLWAALRRFMTKRLAQVSSLILMAGTVLSGAFLHARLGVAAAGLLFRELSPRNEMVIRRSVWIAYAAVLVAIGALLSHASPDQFFSGIVLGALLALLTIAAQAIVAVPLTRKLPWVERVSIMLSQQNGMTAAVLGVTLDQYRPGALPVVAIAIIVINVLHLMTTTLFERWVQRRMPGR